VRNILKQTLASPMFFAFTYLLMIPLFAGIYQHFFAEAFYAPYVRYEPSWKNDLQHAGAMVEQSLKRSSTEPLERRCPLAASEMQLFDSKSPSLHMLILNNIELRDLTLEGTDFHFYLFYSIATAPNVVCDNSVAQGTTWGNTYLSAQYYKRETLYAQRAIRMGPPGVTYADAGILLIKRERDRIDLRNDPILRSLAPHNFSDTERVVFLTDQEEQEIGGLLDESTGISNRIGGDFGRMFYLSGVVITTLGFGDIVPLTWQARVTVEFEAILGIVIAGLFINAVVAKPKDSASLKTPMPPQ